MIHYNDKFLSRLEKEIRYAYNDKYDVFDEYTHYGCLLELRKNMLNDQALTHKNQEELLPHIIAFNDALRDALKHMYDRAHELYRQVSAIQPDIELEAKCLLPYKYPSLHPFQHESRQELWKALCDTGWNPLYESGVTHSIELPRDINLSFDEFIGMKCGLHNWNESLDQSLTKDLHLINAFHNLFDHTNFALTDFIFCRDFEESINIAVNSHLSGEA
jgi:hypothetical protein